MLTSSCWQSSPCRVENISFINIILYFDCHFGSAAVSGAQITPLKGAFQVLYSFHVLGCHYRKTVANIQSKSEFYLQLSKKSSTEQCIVCRLYNKKEVFGKHHYLCNSHDFFSSAKSVSDTRHILTFTLVWPCVKCDHGYTSDVEKATGTVTLLL